MCLGCVVWTLFVRVLTLECVVDFVWLVCVVVCFGVRLSCWFWSLVLVSFVPSVVVRFRLFSSVCLFALVWFLFLLVLCGKTRP